MQNSLLPRRVCESSQDPYLPEKGRAWALEVSVGRQARACYEWETLSLTEHRPPRWLGRHRLPWPLSKLVADPEAETES